MRKAEWGMLGIVILSVVTSIFFYQQLPGMVPSHYDINGNANGYTSRPQAVIIFPIVLAVLFLIFLAIPRIDPRRENIAKFRRYYNAIVFAILFVFYYFSLLFLARGVGVPFNFAQEIMPPLAFLFWIIGMTLPRTEPNWFIGVRTPWTISNADVWKKTNKLGGTFFKVSAIIMLAGFIFPSAAVWLIVVPVLTSSIYLLVYSYVIYERKGKHA